MANPFSRFFGAKPKEEPKETITEATAPEVIKSLVSNSKHLLSNTDVNASDEKQLINLYRQMDSDAIISAALDLYADNATQLNPKTGHVAAVESSDKDFQEEINEFLWDIVDIDSEAWQIVRDVARDGKIFLDTEASPDGTEWTFIPVEDPANIKALTYGQDKIKYFAVSPEEEKDDSAPVSKSFSYLFKGTNDSTKYVIYPSDRYIAGFNTREIVGKMTIASESEYRETLTEELKIRSGRSALAGVVSTWQILSGLEDALFINRLTKSTEFKIVQVDVSDSNNKQAQQIIDSVKDAFKNSETIDQVTNRYQNRQAPIPVNDFIYVPVKGAKGSVTVETVGGEVSEAKIADIDYFRNKLFAGLAMLKAYLGFEETTPGGLGDNTMTKLDERLGRRIQRLQRVLSAIINQIIEYYWRHSTAQRATQPLPRYKLVLGKVSTKEEEENRKRLNDSFDAADRLLSITMDERFEGMVNNEKLFKYIFNDIIGIDPKQFDNQPVEEEIPLKIKELESRILKERKHNNHFLNGKLESLLNKQAIKTFKEMRQEFDLFVETQSGERILLENVLNRVAFKRAFSEKTYKQLKDLSKSRDPERLRKSKKLTAKYTGIDKNNYITFRVTAEDPEKNSAEGKPTSYVTKVALKDLGYLLKANKEDGEKVTDKDIVQMAIAGDVSVSCTCPAAQYWGQAYNGTKDGYSLDKETRAPKRNIPTQTLCKHTILMLTVMPFWANTIVRDLRKRGLLTDKSAAKVDKKVELDELEDNENER